MSQEDHETQSVSPSPVFDFHLHALPLFFKTVFDGTAADDLNLFRQLLHGKGTEPSVLDATVQQMEVNHVHQGLLSGNNTMVQRWVAQYPQRFLASFIPDVDRKDHQAAAEQFEREVEQGKWRAIGELLLSYMQRPLNDPTLFPYYQVCERHGLPVAYHSGLNGRQPHRHVTPHRFRVELGAPLLLQDVVEQFPTLKIVIMHMGWPFFDQALYMLYAYPNVYLDTGVVDWILGPSLFQRMLREAVDTAGNRRILFGSDQMLWPEKIAPALHPILSADFLTVSGNQKLLSSGQVEMVG
jgi:hypothetical protein